MIKQVKDRVEGRVMRVNRILLKLVTLFVLGFVVSALVAASSFASGNGGCSSSAAPAGKCNVLEGFDDNVVSEAVQGGTIGGGGGPGFSNQVTKDFGTVAGGRGNLAGDRATVAGGSENVANGFRASIGGGFENKASGESSTIAGGYGNTASSYRATVGGGNVNTANSFDATVGGGSGNIASSPHATVGGGTSNLASNLDSTVSGGSSNTAGGAFSALGGGSGNNAMALDTAIGGGAGNSASGENGTIGGGLANRASGKFSTVGGGTENVAGGAQDNPAQFPTVGGGSQNSATGLAATVPGGMSNTAAGAFSFAAGRRAAIASGHDGTFLFADSSDFDFRSYGPNEFAVRATGGVRLVTAVDSSGAPSAGVQLARGSGSWALLSDRDSKANIAPVDPRLILARLTAIPISSWNYKTQDPSIRHIGPMAQDLYLLGFGEDSSHISTVDAEGIALAAIQGLNQTVQAQDGRITEQQQEIATLKAEISSQEARTASLEARMAALEQMSGASSTSTRLPSSEPFGGPLLPGLALFGLSATLLVIPRVHRGV
jgi:trimeric autotransporter adhesin